MLSNMESQENYYGIFNDFSMVEKTLLLPVISNEEYISLGYMTPLENISHGYSDSLLSVKDENQSPVYDETYIDRDVGEYHSYHGSAGWRDKQMDQWGCGDVGDWLYDTCVTNDIKTVPIPLFQFSNVTGAELRRMTFDMFMDKMKSAIDPNESVKIGQMLFSALSAIVRSEEEAVVPSTVMDRYPCYVPDSGTKLLDMDSIVFSPQQMPGTAQSDPGYDSYEEQNKYVPPPTKRPPGRPKGSGKKPQKNQKNVSVPEFLRDLLLNPEYCPSIIRWEMYSEGKFRFVRADEVAKLWGRKRDNKRMSFEKFSRAMRYHYKQNVLESVPAVRLVYKFGSKGPSIATDDPNFERRSVRLREHQAVSM